MVKGKKLVLVLIILGIIFGFSVTTLANGVKCPLKHPKKVKKAPSKYRIIYLTMHKGKIVRLPKQPKLMFLGDPGIADMHIRAPGILYFYPKRPGETTLYGADANNKTIFNYTIRVQADLVRLRRMLANMFDIKDLHIEMLNGKILMKGFVDSPKAAEEALRLAGNFVGGQGNIINYIEVNAATQINLRVQIVEMSREISRVIGVNWSAFYDTKNITAGLGMGSVTPISLGGLALSASGKTGNFSFNALIDVLETEGIVSVLSQPTLTALSGETASFLAGGEFPIPVGQPFGTIAVQYKNFGVSLAFTPTLLKDNLINLKVRPEVSELSNRAAVSLGYYKISIPGIVTRRAETTVELRSGQSFVIAGLLQSNAGKYVNEMPGLGKLPVLGNLFRSEDFRRGETELVIIVTPYVVKPTTKENLALPIPATRKKEGFMVV